MASIDAAAFRQFEYEGWEASVAAYDRYFGRLTCQTIEPLLDAARVVSAMKVLDVASGPGYVAAAASQRGADVAGVDFSEQMVAKAGELFPGVSFHHGDAESLPFDTASVDAVVMNFGVLHLAQPDIAFGEAWRVLKAGSFAFTVWCPPAEAVGFAVVMSAIERHGDSTVPLPAGPPFFKFSDAEECRRTLEEAGFGAPSIRTLPMVWDLASSDELFEAFLQGTARTGGLLRAQEPSALAAIRTAVEENCRPYRRDGRLQLPMPALVVSADKSRA